MNAEKSTQITFTLNKCPDPSLFLNGNNSPIKYLGFHIKIKPYQLGLRTRRLPLLIRPNYYWLIRPESQLNLRCKFIL